MSNPSNPTSTYLSNLLEAVLLAAGEPLSVERLQSVFAEDERPSKAELKQCLVTLAAEYAHRGITLVEVASGYQFQAKQQFAPWIAKLWQEKPTKYSRAFLETLAIIAYRQPVTRADIEAVRGVAVNTSIIKTLLERHWINVIGHRDVPGKPAIYGTTKAFLDYFNLKDLQELPSVYS